MTRSLIIAAILGLAACAPETPPATGARPSAAAAPAARPAPAAFNPLDTGTSTLPGSGGGGY